MKRSARMRLTTLARSPWLQACLVLAVVVGTIATASVLNRRVLIAIEQSRNLVRRANAEADAVQDVLEAAKDIETGERGFLLTGLQSYLDPFNAGRSNLDDALRRADELAGGAATGDDMRALRELARQKRAISEQFVALAKTRGRDIAIADMRTSSGKAIMDQVRERVAAILNRIAEEHEVRMVVVRKQEAWASYATLATAAFCATLLGLAVVVLLRGRARLQRAQTEMQALTTRLSGTLANLRDGVAVFGRTGGLLLWNQQFETLALNHAGRLKRNMSLEQIAAAAWPDVRLADPVADGPTLHEVTIGAVTLEIWRGRMPDDQQILLVADITRRTYAEAIARQAQKMEALGQLTGGVAHDFNNLLQVVSTNLEMVGLRLGDNAPASDRLAAALRAVERASKLTRHLLAFARRQPLMPTTIQTSELLASLEDMLLRALGEGITLTLVTEPGLWSIRADPQQLENAILNLAINARDAMGGFGGLTIQAGNAELDADAASRIPEIEAGPYVIIAITDTGIGMTADELGRAMEPFYTTKSDGHGSGLGLPMVFGFAKQSRGHLHLFSQKGHGTTARLYLPRSQSEAREEPEPPVSAESGSGELVLLVEDDAAVRASSMQALRSLGYATIEARDADEALRLLQQGLRPQLLFTDVIMPGATDSRALAEAARGLLPDLAVVFTSGHTGMNMLTRDLLPPGTILVDKPWRTADLAGKLRQALASVRPADPVRLRIVLAEDDHVVRMTTAELMKELGHDVIEACSGAEALGAVRAGCDLLMTDLGLPDIDGLQLASVAMQARPGLPVMIASGRAPQDSAAYVWLEKPYDAAALRAAIGRAVERGLVRTI